MPAIGSPSGGPFGDGIDPKFGIGMDFDGLFFCKLDGFFDGGAFHTDVGGVWF